MKWFNSHSEDILIACKGNQMLHLFEEVAVFLPVWVKYGGERLNPYKLYIILLMVVTNYI